VLVELNVRRRDDPRTEDLLERLRTELGWREPLDVTEDDRIEILFVGSDSDEDGARVKAALDAAGGDWPNYVTVGPRAR
jgi:hypothetical protein